MILENIPSSHCTEKQIHVLLKQSKICNVAKKKLTNNMGPNQLFLTLKEPNTTTAEFATTVALDEMADYEQSHVDL